MTWLFLGLARAGGFDASPVRIATRDDHFFKPNIMRTRDLNTNVVLVKLNGKDMYFDPGSAFAPFGLLPWAEAGTVGLKLDKDGGTWVTTALPESSASQIVRKADLNLTSDGSLEGKLTVRRFPAGFPARESVRCCRWAYSAAPKNTCWNIPPGSIRSTFVSSMRKPMMCALGCPSVGK